MPKMNDNAKVDSNDMTSVRSVMRSGLEGNGRPKTRDGVPEPQPHKQNRVVDMPGKEEPGIAPEGYTVGLVCALPLEMAAVELMLDQTHPEIPEQDAADHNSYTLGQIQGHNVVIACLPAGTYGTTTAATVAKDLLRTFKSIRFGLMVGIGGGAPSRIHDIRLGDIVVSQPDRTNGGVIQYDRGKTVKDGEFQRTGSLNAPPQTLLTALARLQAKHMIEESRVPQFLDDLVAKVPKKAKKKFSYQGAIHDCLYLAEYDHIDVGSTCEECDLTRTVQRDERDDTDPVIYYGTIASGNQVIKHGTTRDRLSKELGALCFEMEAAGLQDFPSLVIRGICDYADSHKNKMWQEYAAAAAAAFAKELLSYVRPDRVLQEKPIPQLVPIAKEQLQASKKHLDVSTEHLEEHKRTNQMLENRPLDLHTVHEARYDSVDVGDSPRCVSDTRLRIRQTISTWADQDSGESVFWLVGPAGTGKSTIMRTIADSFTKDKRLAAGYFFKRGEKGRNDTSRLFTTLAMQLADAMPSFKDSLRTSLGDLDGDAVEKKGLAAQFEKLLWSPLGQLPPANTSDVPMVIIIDALDECERPEHIPQILALLSKLPGITTDRNRIRVLVASRSASEIVEALEPLVESKTVRSLEIHREFSEDTKADIRTFLETRFADIRSKRRVQQDPWPTAEELDRLVELATKPEPLFIYAATLCRYVYDEQHPRNPKRQLKLWFKQCEENKSQLHQMYDPIFSQLFRGDKSGESSRQLLFLYALTLLAAPLPAPALVTLLDLDMDDVYWWLPELHPVLDIPTDSQKPIRLLHKSFSDFLLDRENLGPDNYRVEAADIHALLAAKCVLLMTAELKQDICDIQKLDATPGAVDEKIMNQRIPAHLGYACLHWTYHVEGSERSPENYVYTFLFQDFLHWLEVLSLLRHLSSGISAVRRLLKLFKRFSDTPSEIVNFLTDANRIILSFGSIIERAPLQSYGALLLFSPVASELRQRYWSQRLPSLSQVQGVKALWDPYLQTLEGQYDYVSDLAFSPDGELLASASDDGTIRLWIAATGSHLLTLGDYGGSAAKVTFSPNSQYLASESNSMTKIWNVMTGTCMHMLDSNFKAIAFLPDSQRLASASNLNIVQLWNMKSGKRDKTFHCLEDSRPVTQVAFSPNVQTVASVFLDNMIRLWKLESGTTQHILKGQPGRIGCIGFSPDGQLFASQQSHAVGDDSIRLWDVTTGELSCVFCLKRGQLKGIAFSPDSQLLALATRAGLKFFNIATGTLQNTFGGGDDSVVAFSPDSQLLASGSQQVWPRTRPPMIRFWDVTLGTNEQGWIFDPSDRIIAVTVSPDGKAVATGSTDSTVQLWDAVTGLHQMELRCGLSTPIERVVFSPDSKHVACTGVDRNESGHLWIWNMEDGKLEKVLDDQSGFVRAVAYSTNGQLVALGLNNTIELHEAPTGTCIYTLKGHTDKIYTMVFSPDSQVLASSSADGMIRLWNTNTGTFRCMLENPCWIHPKLVFSPNSELLASIDGGISYWNVATGTHQHTLDKFGAIYNAAFSPNTQLLAVARRRSNYPGTRISILDATTGVCKQRLESNEEFVTEFVFACDSQLLATASADRTVRIWDATTCSPRQTLSHSDHLTKLRFSPDNELIAAAALDRTVQLWSSTTGMHLQSICYGKGLVHEISFSENELVVSVSDDDFEVCWSPWRSMALKTHTYGTAAQQTVTPNLAVRGLGLDADETWITKDSKRIVWLPKEYRSNGFRSWARSESMIFIGCGSDQLIRFRIS